MTQLDPTLDDNGPNGPRRRLHLREVSLAGADQTENYDGVGAVLAAARLALGLNLDEAATELRIRRTYIEAIETGRFDALPGQAYTQGFVRSYAIFLKLDAEDVLERLREETRARGTSNELIFPTPMAEARLPGLRVLAVSLLIAGVAYVGWAMSNWDSATLERVPPVPDQLLNRRDVPVTPAPTQLAPLPQTAPAPVAPAPQASLAAPSAPAAQSSPAPGQSPPALASTAGPKPVAAGLLIGPVLSVEPWAAPPSLIARPKLARIDQAPATDPTKTEPPKADPAKAEAPKVEASKPVDGPKGHIYGVNEPARIVVKANADTWVRVDEPSGSAVLRRILRAGDSYNVPDRSDLLMSVGSAGAIEVLVDGQSTASLGSTAEVRQRIPLEAEALKRGIPRSAKPGKAAKKPDTADAQPSEPSPPPAPAQTSPTPASGPTDSGTPQP
jgi:cytoskeleton protein RodZ